MESRAHEYYLTLLVKIILVHLAYFIIFCLQMNVGHSNQSL